MANELDVGSIVMRIRADMSGVQEGLKQLEAAMGQAQEKVKQSGEGVEESYTKMGQSAQNSAAAQAAAAATMSAAAMKAMSIIVGAIDTGIDAINRYRSALMGLEGIASGRGINSQAMTEALDEVTDAFFDAASASTAFKNLLTRGYSLEQATQSILRLKDAAAFGRQASLGLAEAVVTATEGLKNENSVLVDNAGVTKNVSVMWREYAASIGTSVDKLTQAQKVEAEVQGILNETRFQVGDLAKLQASLAGTQAATAMSGEELARAYGDSLAPAVEGVTRLWGAFLDAIAGALQEFPGLVSGATTASLAIGGFVVAAKAAQAIQALNLSLQAASGSATLFGLSMKAALPIVGAIAAVIGVGTMIYTNHAKAQEQAAEQAEELRKAEEEKQATLQNTVRDLRELGLRYDLLSGKTNLTLSESQEIMRIEEKLRTEYGLTGSVLQELAGDYGTVTAAIREKRMEALKELQESKNTAAAAAKAALKEAEVRVAAGEKYLALEKEIQAKGEQLKDVYYQSAGTKLYKEVNALKEEQKELLAIIQPSEIERYADAHKNAVVDYVTKQIDAITNAYEISGGEVDEAVKSLLDRLFIDMAEAPKNDIQANVDQLMDIYGSALRNADIGEAVQHMVHIQRQILMGATPTEADLQTIGSSWSVIENYATSLGNALNLTEEQVHGIFQRMAPDIYAVTKGMENLENAPEKLIQAWQQNNMATWVNQDAEAMKKALDEMGTVIEDTERDIGALGGKLRGQSSVTRALETLQEAMAKGDTSMIKAATKALEDLGQQVPRTQAEVARAIQEQQVLQRASSDTALQALNDLNTMQQSIRDKQQAMLDAGGTEDSNAWRQMEAYIVQLERAKRALGEDARFKGVEIFTPEQLAQMDKATQSVAAWEAEQVKLNEALNKSREEIAAYNKQLEALETIQQGLMSGNTDTAAYKAAEEYLATLPELAGLSLDSIEGITEAIALQESMAAAAQGRIEERIAQINAELEAARSALATMEDPTDQSRMEATIRHYERILELAEQIKAGTYLSPMVDSFDMATASAEQLQAELDRSTKAANDLQAALTQKANLREKVAEIKRVADAQLAGKASAEEWAKAQNGFAQIMGRSAQNAQEMSTVMALELGNIDQSMSGLQGQAQGLMSWIQQLLSYIGSNSATLNINTGPAVAALNYLIGVYNAIAGVFGWKRIGGGGGGSGSGGGGGKSALAKDLDTMAHDIAMGRLTLEGELQRLEQLEAKYRDRRGRSTLKQDDQRELDERIYSAQEELRKKALADDYAALEHKKALNQVAVSDEIAELERLKTAHELNADELREIEEKLHEARERQRNELYEWDMALLDHKKAMGELSATEEIASLKRIQEAHELTTQQQYAIEERLYSLRMQAQEAALQKQSDSVKKVYRQITDALRKRLQDERDMELRAIDDRISALDKLTAAENEAAHAEDYQRQLADKQRELSVTKSARRRRELQVEIDKMEADEALRLKQQEREAEKAALQDQKKAVQNKYATLMSEENMRQEALRLVMSQNLQAMTELIQSYGSEWQDAGTSLAEHLTKGLHSRQDAILDVINRLDEGIQARIQTQLNAIGSGLPAINKGGIVININGMTIREEADIDKLAESLYRKIQ